MARAACSPRTPRIAPGPSPCIERPLLRGRVLGRRPAARPRTPSPPVSGRHCATRLVLLR
eukprot:2269830-Pleurochrysis_carterae.AAC.1